MCIRDRAEDAVHDTYVRIVKYMYKIDESNIGRTINFLLIICRNISIDIYKKNRQIISIEDIEYNIDIVSTPLDVVITNDSIKRITDCIKRLKPIYRDVMLLKYDSDCNNEEISGLLNIKETTVRKRLERARRELTKILEEEEIR